MKIEKVEKLVANLHAKEEYFITNQKFKIIIITWISIQKCT